MVQLSKEGFIQPEQLRSFLQEVKSAATYQASAKGLLLSDMKIVEDGEVNRWFNDVQEKVEFILNMASEIEDTAALTKGAAAVKTAAAIFFTAAFPPATPVWKKIEVVLSAIFAGSPTAIIHGYRIPIWPVKGW